MPKRTRAAALSIPELRSLAARVAASEAAHLAFLAGGVGDALPRLLDLERATELLAPYWG